MLDSIEFLVVQNLFRSCLGCREFLTDPGFQQNLITACIDLINRFSTDQGVRNRRFYYEMIVNIADCDRLERLWVDRGADFDDRLCLKVDLDAVELDLIAL